MAMPAAHPAEPVVEGVVHLLGDAGALQQGGHEDEQRDGYEHILRHQIEDLLGENIEWPRPSRPVRRRRRRSSEGR